MAYTVVSEVQTQETDLAGAQIDVMAVRFHDPNGWTGEIRVPLVAGWDQTAIAYIDQRVTEMGQVAPATSTIVDQAQVQEVGPVGNLLDVMQVTFETNPELFVGVVRVPIAVGWPGAASQGIDLLTTEMQAVAAAG
jgi:hypothetical protein